MRENITVSLLKVTVEERILSYQTKSFNPRYLADLKRLEVREVRGQDRDRYGLNDSCHVRTGCVVEEGGRERGISSWRVAGGREAVTATWLS